MLGHAVATSGVIAAPPMSAHRSRSPERRVPAGPQAGQTWDEERTICSGRSASATSASSGSPHTAARRPES